MGAAGRRACLHLEELVGNFVTPLFDLVTEHRELVLALVAAREYHSDAVDGGGLDLDVLLRRMDAQAQIESLGRGLQTSPDAKLTIRVATALVMGMGLLSDWLLPKGTGRPTENEIVGEMVRLITYGVTARGEITRPESGNDTMSPLLLNQLLDRLVAAERRAVHAELELERIRG